MDEKLINRLESAVTRLEALCAGQADAEAISSDGGATDPSIAAFDDLISQYVRGVTSAAEKIGGQVLDVSKIIEEAFNVEKELLVQIKQTQKPDVVGIVEYLKPLNGVIAKASALTEGRRSDFFHHLKTGADSLGALAWIAYTGKDCGMIMPVAHVEESWQTAEFYSNKVLVDYRNKDVNHVEWVKAMKELYVPGLRDYVKTHYPLGPIWSATEKKIVKAPAPPPASLFTSQTSSSSSLFTSQTSSSSSNPKGGMSAVFAEISGKSVTAGLRKVTDDMKSKNRAERTGVVTASEKEPRAASPSISKPKAAAPPKFELQMGRKWVVENQIGQSNLVIDECDAKQTVYIFGCKNSVLQIKGKVNNITVDKCTKMGVVFKDVVAAFEIVNCNSLEVQSQGLIPTILVDNSAGCQIYLSKDSLEATITTTKSTEVNIIVPASEADGVWGEHPLPQQYVHVYKDGQFVTTPMSHSGA